MLPIYCVAILMIALSSAPAASGQAPNGMVPILVEWVDPTEHAFTVKVPQGWTINGGTKWQGPTSVRGFVTAESPDGKIHVFLDDPRCHSSPGAASPLRSHGMAGRDARPSPKW